MIWQFGRPVPGLLSETVRHTQAGETRGELPQLGIKFALSVDKKSSALMKALKLPTELVTYETDRSDGFHEGGSDATKSKVP